MILKAAYNPNENPYTSFAQRLPIIQTFLFIPHVFINSIQNNLANLQQLF